MNSWHHIVSLPRELFKRIIIKSKLYLYEMNPPHHLSHGPPLALIGAIGGSHALLACRLSPNFFRDICSSSSSSPPPPIINCFHHPPGVLESRAAFLSFLSSLLWFFSSVASVIHPLLSSSSPSYSFHKSFGCLAELLALPHRARSAFCSSTLAGFVKTRLRFRISETSSSSTSSFYRATFSQSIDFRVFERNFLSFESHKIADVANISATFYPSTALFLCVS